MDLRRTIEAIKRAKTDANVKVLIARISEPGAMANVQELREAILEFKGSGKQTICFTNQLSQEGYYLSTAFDKIYSNETGYLPLSGLYHRMLFFKGLAEKLSLDFTISRNNKLKSFPDLILEDKFTSEYKESQLNLMKELQEMMYKDIAVGRNMPYERIQSLSKFGPFISVEAVMNGLMDGISQALTKVDEPAIVDLSSYGSYRSLLSIGKDKIAIIHVQGEIGESDGESDASPIVMEKAFRHALENKVKAIVLRVNSPGGEVGAGVKIRHMVLEAKSKGIPVIASFGNIAASGAYWISADADHIVADPASIVGSIGVFGIAPHFGKLLESYGITNDELSTGDNAFILDPFNPTEKGKKRMDLEIEEISNQFEEIVSKGRRMPMNKVKQIATGEVWTGKRAQQLGLVDSLGGLSTAIELAKQKGNIKGEPQILDYPRVTFVSSLVSTRNSTLSVLQNPSLALKRVSESFVKELTKSPSNPVK
eukprot:TRINITY_DN4243_c0_g1_i1.p1 TRINITY_DN4243_c0_g1~~TRINITY_DN4243_c0_g1_i1.p1  ORF type:complete len:482 (-),score=148.73 TRINITY_DN4243_c0_g1_i1:122-1567(-)